MVCRTHCCYGHKLATTGHQSRSGNNHHQCRQWNPIHCSDYDTSLVILICLRSLRYLLYLLLVVLSLADKTIGGEPPPEMSTKAAVLEDLYITNPSDDRNDIKLKAGWQVPVRGSCEWIMTTEVVSNWLESSGIKKTSEPSSNVLWLHGNPGQGKSTMAIYLTEKLSKLFSQTNENTLTYVFCSAGGRYAENASNILRGLLHMLYSQCPQLLSDGLRREHKQAGKNIFRRFSSLWRHLLDSAQRKVDGYVYCIIDGLDECSEGMDDMLRQIQQTFETATTRSRLKVFVSSRPYKNISNCLSTFPNQDLSSFPQSRSDVTLFINHELDRLSRAKGYSVYMRGLVKEALEAKAEGTFLWVGLACNQLSYLQSRDVPNYLKRLPSGVSAMYAAIFSSLLSKDCDEREENQRILQFVAASARPLTLIELSEACELDISHDRETRVQCMIDRILELGLLVIKTTINHTCHQNGFESPCNCASARRYLHTYYEDLDDNRVVLLHQSVREYMFQDLAHIFRSEEELHATASYRCLDAVISYMPGSVADLKSCCFATYAIRYWTWHAAKALDSFEVQPEHYDFFTLDSTVRQRWVRLHEHLVPDRFRRLYSTDPCRTILNIAGYWGISPLVDHVSTRETQILLERGSFPLDIGNEYSYGKFARLVASPLVDAICNGHFETLTRLLELPLPLTFSTLSAAAKYHQYAEPWQIILHRRKIELLQRQDIHHMVAQFASLDAMNVLANDERFQISKDWIYGALQNESFGSKILDLLKLKFGLGDTIADDLVDFATEYCPAESVEALLTRYPDVVVSRHHITNAVANFDYGRKVLPLLLHRRRKSMEIDDELIILAIQHEEYSVDYLKIFFDILQDDLVVSRRVLLSALRRGVDHDSDDTTTLLELLLDRRNAQINIDDEALRIIFHFTRSLDIPMVVSIILSHIDRTINFTVSLFKVASEYVLAKDFPNVWEECNRPEITPTILLAVFKNSSCRSLLRYIFGHMNEHVAVITTAVVEAALKCKDADVIVSILRKRQSEVLLDQDIFYSWCQDKEVLDTPLLVLVACKAGAVSSILNSQKGNYDTQFTHATPTSVGEKKLEVEAANDTRSVEELYMEDGHNVPQGVLARFNAFRNESVQAAVIDVIPEYCKGKDILDPLILDILRS